MLLIRDSFKPVAYTGFALIVLWLVACSGARQTDATGHTAVTEKIAPILQAAAQQLQSGSLSGPVSGVVRSDSQGRIQVYVYVSDTSADNVASLADHGLQDIAVSSAMHIVQGWVKPQDLENLAALPFVTRITPPHYARPR